MDAHIKVTTQRPRNSEGKKKLRKNCCFALGGKSLKSKKGKVSKREANRIGNPANKLEHT